MPKIFTSKQQKTGEIGENIAVKYLLKQGYAIKDRNYTRKWGELDIIAEKSGQLHFIEVKSVSRDLATPASTSPSLSRHQSMDQYSPEDNMHPWKLKRISRTIQTYLLSNNIPETMNWQVDLIVIFMDLANKKARVKVVNDIIL